MSLAITSRRKINMPYTLTCPAGILRKDGAEVANDDPDYYAWLEAGNGPAVINEEPIRRIQVSAWQIRKALNATGLREQVEIAVADSGNIELLDGWSYATTFDSDNELALSIGGTLNKSIDDMYELFKLAESL